jgi:hypothetical protein
MGRGSRVIGAAAMLVALVLVLCRPASGSEQEEVKATLVAMWKAIEDGDADAYAQFIHPEFSQFGESDVYLAEGGELEVESIRKYVERATDVHCTAVP